MNIDWYEIETDLKTEIFSEISYEISQIQAQVSKLDRLGYEEKPPKLLEQDLKEMKKAELVEMLLEQDEVLHLEMDGTGETIKENVEEAIEDIEQAVLSLDERVLSCLKRSVRHMEGDG